MSTREDNNAWIGHLEEFLKSLPDDRLAMLIGGAREEQAARAIAAADPTQLVEHGYDTLFNHKGTAADPEIVSGVLVCAGSYIPRSAASAASTFAHIDGHWCWEHPDVLTDELRRIPNGKHDTLKSVTLLPAIDGMKVDIVHSTKSRQGSKATKVDSYEVQGGELRIVETRRPPASTASR